MPPMALLLPVAWWLLMLLQPATTQGSTSAQARSLKVNVPSYTRGKGLYRFVLSERDRANGVSYYGSAERLRIAIDKMKKGEPVRISTVGGSITAGQGASDGLSWPQYVFNWASDHYGENVTGVNGAVAGTISSYMSVCHNMHVPKDADIIFVEYSVNDVTPKEPPFINNIRRAFERLLRKLLQYPNRPAVVLMHSYIWGQPVPFVGSYWSNAEHELSKFGLYYGLPSLSVKAAVYHHMVAGEAGFQVNNSRNSDPDGLGGVSFYYDRVHPDGTTGARMTAELAMQLIRLADRDIGLLAVSEEDKHWSAAPLPKPMIPDNYESGDQRCFIGEDFTQKVVNKTGWDWINESKTKIPKWGFVSTTPNSTLMLSLDTRSEVIRSAAMSAMEEKVLIELAYLKSYQNMGKAKLSCMGGCECKPRVMNAHNRDDNTSQLHLFKLFATQSAECLINITVSDGTDSGQHKVKIAGVIISEEVGDKTGLRNKKAIESVHDRSSMAKVHGVVSSSDAATLAGVASSDANPEA